MDSNEEIGIAVIGGGLAGATLVNALLKHARLRVHIFESAAEFSERGAAVGLAHNAQAALDEIGPEMNAAVDRAGAVQMHSSRLLKGTHPGAGELVVEIAAGTRGKVVHRAALLHELLKPVPNEIMHTSKKLAKIEDNPGQRVMLYFEDGSQFEADAVIGADGIHGLVRSYILGEEHAALKPEFAGFWDCRALVPMEKARKVLGEEYFPQEEQRQYGWYGDGGWFMHDVLDGQDTVQCVASVVAGEDWDQGQWTKQLDRKQLEDAFSSWGDSPVKDGMIEACLLLENPDLKAFAQWHHNKDTPTFCKGRLCIMGDAAHASTPWQGSGAGQAIEDAMILGTVLGHVLSVHDLGPAFEAYDRVRRLRANNIVASSKEVGNIMCGRGPGIGLDVDKIRTALGSKWRFIHGQDQIAQREAAVSHMYAIHR